MFKPFVMHKKKKAGDGLIGRYGTVLSYLAVLGGCWRSSPRSRGNAFMARFGWRPLDKRVNRNARKKQAALVWIRSLFPGRAKPPMKKIELFPRSGPSNRTPRTQGYRQAHAWYQPREESRPKIGIRPHCIGIKSYYLYAPFLSFHIRFH